MKRYLPAFFGVLVSLTAVPAAANIIIYATPDALQPDENVLLNSSPPTGNNAFGVTNQTGTEVTFTGIEALLTPSNGQARLEAADGGLSQLDFALTDDTLGFTEVEFNIFGTGASASSVDLRFTDQFGMIFTDTFTINDGQNFFSAEAVDNQFITSVGFTLNSDVREVRQFRIGGIGAFDGGGGGGGTGNTVPEPASWALLIAGFGVVGAAARRRRSLVTVTV